MAFQSVSAGRGPGLSSEKGGSGGRTRTPNGRARTCCVADYTTPDWALATLAAGQLTTDSLAPPHQPAKAHDPADRHLERLFHELGHLAQPGDGRRPGRGD